MNFEKQSVKIAIFDITGREVLNEIRHLEGADEIKMGGVLLNGTYLVKVEFEDGNFDMHRLIIPK